MFAFVISLVVVAGAVVFATRIVLKDATEPDQPATPRPQRVRGMVVEAYVPSAYRRIRSGLLLIVIVTVLGALTALLLVIGGAILLTGLRTAVQ